MQPCWGHITDLVGCLNFHFTSNLTRLWMLSIQCRSTLSPFMKSILTIINRFAIRPILHPNICKHLICGFHAPQHIWLFALRLYHLASMSDSLVVLAIASAPRCRFHHGALMPRALMLCRSSRGCPFIRTPLEMIPLVPLDLDGCKTSVPTQPSGSLA